MSNLVLLLGDQLSESISSLKEFNKNTDAILLCEVAEETDYVPHHPKKIAFIFSAMRHFATELKHNGFKVRYIKLDDPDNTNSFDNEVTRAIKDLSANKLIVTEPGEWRVLEKFKSWQKSFDIEVEIRSDDRFLSHINDFKEWAHGKIQLRMEFFYREMRKKHNILMDTSGKPEGGKWNYDSENREKAPRSLKSPKRISHKKDKITLEVLELVSKKFSKNFGNLLPFHMAVTREQALKELSHFIDELLPNFGKYQDVMISGEAYLYHSLIASYLNVGLILPLEVCKLAEAKYHKGGVSLNSAEGFIRQILGWREYIRGIYWLKMPKYKEQNFLNAHRKLPNFYWGAKTNMHCISEAVSHTKEHAYSHHIQRLMITGNFALLAGIDPKEVCDWYLAVYADAFDWVELPNTLGMALFGDGGVVASKPYAASGKYISRMSNFCKSCPYDPEVSIGDHACPFNSLYWNFISKNESKFSKNQRMLYVYATLKKMDKQKLALLQQHASKILKSIENGEVV
jgi:deoxyribodipyrimidine photolyase-related protein